MKSLHKGSVGVMPYVHNIQCLRALCSNYIKGMVQHKIVKEIIGYNIGQDYL